MNRTIKKAAAEYAKRTDKANAEWVMRDFISGVEFAQRWIPVEEELPEIPEKLSYGRFGILVLVKYHQIMPKFPHEEKRTEDIILDVYYRLPPAYGSGLGFGIEHTLIPYKVTHWKYADL
jgi:hypothetical protein